MYIANLVLSTSLNCTVFCLKLVEKCIKSLSNAASGHLEHLCMFDPRTVEAFYVIRSERYKEPDIRTITSQSAQLIQIYIEQLERSSPSD